MLESENRVDVSSIIENHNRKPIIRLHLASYFRVSRTKQEKNKIYASYGLKAIYDPVRITPEINEKLWEYQYADKKGFFTFLPQRLILGHTLESIEVPANISLKMREFFYSEKTRKVLPLTTNLGAPLIHPGSTGPQTYEIINKSNRPLNLRVSQLICDLDVEYLNESSILAQQKLSKGQFSNQNPGEIKLGDPGKDWEIQAIKEILRLK